MPHSGMYPPSPVVSSRSNSRVKQLRAAFAGQARLSGGLVAIEGADNVLVNTLTYTPASPTPEPSSLIMLGTGILGAAGAIRRKLCA